MRLAPIQGELEFDRVRAAIGDSIEQFARSRLAGGRAQFRADELREHVARVHKSAPASADRILRALRQDGRLDYKVVDRRASLYEITAVGERKAA